MSELIQPWSRGEDAVGVGSGKQWCRDAAGSLVESKFSMKKDGGVGKSVAFSL